MRRLRVTVENLERQHGSDHRRTLAAKSNLAATYRAAGRLHDAIALDEQVLVDRARVLGADHQDTITSRNNLAADHFEAGDVRTAITLLQRVVADRERVFGFDHPDTRTARDNLVVAREAVLASSGPGSCARS